jgi:THO complex subunit 2
MISFFQNLASVLEKRVEKVCEEEKDKRKDLYIRARSYQGKLSLCKPRMMKEENFHLVSIPLLS